MNNKEKELVEISEQTYNLCEGGKGGFGYINRLGLGHNSELQSNRRKNKLHSKETKKKLSQLNLANEYYKSITFKKGKNNGFFGKIHSEVSRIKMKKVWEHRRFLKTQN